MKIIWKIIGIVAAILFGLGIVMLLAAVFTGGSLESIRNNVALTDYEQSFNGQDIHTLELDFDAGTLRILPAETLRVEARNMVEREFYCVLNDGTLRVNDSWGESWADSLSRFLTMWKQDAEITIYLPEGTELRVADIDISAGVADISDISAEQFVLDMSAGDVYLQNLNTHYCELEMSAGSMDVLGLKAAELQLNSSAGSMGIRDLETAVLDLESSAGSLDVRGTVSDYCGVDISAGSVALRLTGSAEDYSAYIERTAGSIRYNGESYKSARIGSGAGTMKLECTAGSIEVEFIH